MSRTVYAEELYVVHNDPLLDHAPPYPDAFGSMAPLLALIGASVNDPRNVVLYISRARGRTRSVINEQELGTLVTGWWWWWWCCRTLRGGAGVLGVCGGGGEGVLHTVGSFSRACADVASRRLRVLSLSVMAFSCGHFVHLAKLVTQWQP